MKLIISDGENDEEQIEFVVLPETFDRVFDVLTKSESLDSRSPTMREPEPAFAGAFCSCHQYTPSQINLGKCGLCGKPPRS